MQARSRGGSEAAWREGDGGVRGAVPGCVFWSCSGERGGRGRRGGLRVAARGVRAGADSTRESRKDPQGLHRSSLQRAPVSGLGCLLGVSFCMGSNTLAFRVMVKIGGARVPRGAQGFLVRSRCPDNVGPHLPTASFDLR